MFGSATLNINIGTEDMFFYKKARSESVAYAISLNITLLELINIYRQHMRYTTFR